VKLRIELKSFEYAAIDAPWVQTAQADPADVTTAFAQSPVPFENPSVIPSQIYPSPSRLGILVVPFCLCHAFLVLLWIAYTHIPVLVTNLSYPSLCPEY